MDPRLIYAPPCRALDLQPSEQQEDHITTLNRPRSIPPFALSEHLLAGCPRLTPPTGPPHLSFQRVRRRALSAQGSPQVIPDSFYKHFHVGSSIPGPQFPSIDQVSEKADAAQAVAEFDDDVFAELLSFLNNSFDNPKFQPSEASDSPYTASPAPTLTQPLATPTIVPPPLDGPVFSSSHHPAPDVASPSHLSTDFNQSPFLVSSGGNAGVMASPAKQRADPATRSVSPVKSKRPATSRIRSPDTPHRREASRSVRGVASPLSVEVLPTSTESSPAETVCYPDPRSRMWGRPSSDDDSTARSPASSPAKEVLTPSFRTSPPKTLRCPHDGCTSMFARAHDLRRHARIHTGILPFTCLACKKGFNRSDGRQRHWKQDPDCEEVHMGLEERGYDGGGKTRRRRKNQGRETAESDLVTTWGSSVALPIAETTSTALEPSLLGPSLNALTRRASSTPLLDVSSLLGSSFPIPTPLVTSAPDPPLSLFAGTDNALYLDL